MPYYVSLGKARVKVVWTAPASSSPVTLQQAGVGPWYCNRLESEQGSLCRYSSLYLHRYSSLFLFHVQVAITSGNLQVGVRDVLIPVRSTGWRLVWRRPVGRVCRLHAAVPTTWAAFNLLVPKQWPVLPLVLETPPSCTVNSKRWVIQEFSRRLDLRPGPGSATAAVAHRRASGRPSVGNQWPVGCSWTCESGALVGAVQVNVGAVQAKEAVRASKTKKTRLQRRYRAGAPLPQDLSHLAATIALFWVWGEILQADCDLGSSLWMKRANVASESYYISNRHSKSCYISNHVKSTKSIPKSIS